MKIIIIRSCLNCPHSDIRNPEEEGGELWCGDRCMLGKMKHICSGKGDFIHPSCNLTDTHDLDRETEEKLDKWF